MGLIEAIVVAYNGKFETIDIQDNGSSCSWNMIEDEGYMRYQEARNKLSKHKVISMILKNIGWI